MYIDVDENITEMQAGPSLEIDGPPIIEKKTKTFLLIFAHWLLIFVVVVHMSALYPDPEIWVPIESTYGQQDPERIKNNIWF